MVGPVGERRLLAGKNRQPPIEEIAKAEPSGVNIFPIAEHEIHRHVERIFAVALIAEPVVEHERQHPRARGVGVFPDMAAEAAETVGLALGEGRIGEQGGGDRLERQADAEFLYHIGFGRVIQVNLDGAGAKHHVEPERTHARHMLSHDLVAPLGHHRQFGAGLVGPHPEAEEAEPKSVADRFDLLQMAAAFGAALVQIAERRARQFELARGLEADIAVGSGQRDDLAVFLDGLPAKFGQPLKEVADPFWLVP